MRLREAALSAAKAGRVPDLEAFVGLQRYEEDGSDALAFGMGMPLPLFDRNQGEIEAAGHALAQATAERESAEIALTTSLAAAHALLTAAHNRVQALRSRVVPSMEEAFGAAREGYQQGKFGFLDMLDAQRGLFEARGALLDALTDYHGAVGEIERITGIRMEELARVQEENTR